MLIFKKKLRDGKVAFILAFNSFFITGNAPLILEIFNNKTHVSLFLNTQVAFFSYVLLFTILLMIF